MAFKLELDSADSTTEGRLLAARQMRQLADLVEGDALTLQSPSKSEYVRDGSGRVVGEWRFTDASESS